MLNIYVNYPKEKPNFSTVAEAIAYISKEYVSLNSCFPESEERIEQATIHIAPGVYRELLVLERPNVTLLGEDPKNTILVYGNCALGIMPDGSKRGTFRSASMYITAHDICAKNLTFQNDAGHRHKAAQALAVYVDGDRIMFRNCRFLGCTDTAFTAPLPDKTSNGLEFDAPGAYKPRTMGRHYYEDCYIQGDLDFIFGGAIAYFQKCEIFSIMPEQIPAENRNGKTIYGFITAASTPKGAPFGYVFKDCILSSNCPPHSVMLGRPWREYAQTVFLNCYMGEHIHPEGWSDWGKPIGNFYYAEYRSYGPGASPDQRIYYSHQMNDKEAARYSIENVLQGWMR